MTESSAVRLYDVAVAYWCERDDMFVRRLKEYAAQNGVNLFVVEQLWIEEFLRKYSEQKLGIRILLDMASDPADPANPYTRLSNLAKERGARVINEPGAATRFSHKGDAHVALRDAGLPVPFGLVVKIEDADRRVLTAEELQGLQPPFFIKPCHGYGGKGVLGDCRDVGDIHRAYALFPDSHFLLQKRVEFGELAGQPAYWRVICILGEIHLCWWHPQTQSYKVVIQWQIEDFSLWPLFDLGQRLAQVTGLEFFSVEAARSPSGEYLLVDYVNEQIDLRPKSFFADGVPDELLRRIARRVARFAEEQRPTWSIDRDTDHRDERLLSWHERYRAAGRTWAAVAVPAAPLRNGPNANSG